MKPKALNPSLETQNPKLLQQEPVPVASRDLVPEVNKVTVGSRRGQGQATSSKKMQKKQAKREEDREGEEKKETGIAESTAYLQLKGQLLTYNSLGLH